MIKTQLIRRGIKDEKVLSAIEKIPREAFVPQSASFLAYEDTPLIIEKEQTISQPYITAYMVELLELVGHENVLEIGTGSGYQTAILAECAEQVTTIEIHEELSKKAKDRLNDFKYTNIHYRIKNGYEGDKKRAPYDAIIVSAYAEKIPPGLLEQLGDPGVLVIPLGNKYIQEIVLYKKENKEVSKKKGIWCNFVPLINKI